MEHAESKDLPGGPWLWYVRSMEQLCLKSSGFWRLNMFRGIPSGLVSENRIEDGQQLAHARDDGDLLRLAGGDQAAVENLDHRVVVNGRACPVPAAPRSGSGSSPLRRP